MPGPEVVTAVASLHAVVDSVTEAPVWSMTDHDCRETLVALAALEARLVELRSRVITQAEAVQAYPGSRVADGFAVAARVTRREAGAQVGLAGLLAAHDLTRAALGAGEVLAEQARVICRAVDDLPDDVEASLVIEAELHLLAEAKHHDAKALAVLGRHLLEVVDPDADQAHQARLLADQEAAAQAATRLTMSDDGHGRTHGRFTIPTAHAAMLRAALSAIAAPKHQNGVGGAGTYDPGTPTPARLGQALVEYVETYPADVLPVAGRINATVVVTMTLDTLLGGLGSAVLDTGDEITAAQARRLACEAGVIPAVLGTDSAVLDLGRTSRFYNHHQRIALGITQRHCQHPGCDVPAARCHVHHEKPWAHGGRTDLADAVLLCPRHHHLEHHPVLRT